MLVKPIYEFLLWDNCTNNCAFCFQRRAPRLFSCDFQKKILDNVIQLITSNKFEIGSHVLLVGGELFDDSNRTFIVKFFSKVCNLMKQNCIDLCYLNTNLLYNDVDLLFSVLEVYQHNKLLDRLKFTTSYDIDGRFKTYDREQLFLKNLHSVTSNYKVNVVTNVILTERLCKQLLTSEFSLSKFSSDNNTSLNLIPYIILDDSLAPSKNLVMQALQYIKTHDIALFKEFIFNLNIKQPRKMFYFKDCNDVLSNTLTSCECKLLPCGHSENFKRYTTAKDSCFVCDVNEVFNAEM